MSYENVASVVVAALDLSVVRLVRGAVASNLIGSPGPLGTVTRPQLIGTLQGDAPISNPRFQPRYVVEPTAKIEPRPILHLRPQEARSDLLARTVASEPVEAPTKSQPLPPPWKMPLPQTHTTLAIKRYLCLVDTAGVGGAINRFA